MGKGRQRPFSFDVFSVFDHKGAGDHQAILITLIQGESIGYMCGEEHYFKGFRLNHMSMLLDIWQAYLTLLCEVFQHDSTAVFGTIQEEHTLIPSVNLNVCGYLMPRLDVICPAFTYLYVLILAL